MNSLDTTLNGLDWMDISWQLGSEGYAVLPGLLGAEEARRLARHFPAWSATRAALETDDLGRGELFYFGAAMPTPLDEWRAALYSRLVVIANRWNETLGLAHRYPADHESFLLNNRQAGQMRGQSYVSRLGVEDHVSLHQRNEGAHVFPMQVVVLLSEPGVDFEGGEFVLTEQRPRMQSRPMVLPLQLGDVAIITTAEKPFKGAKGYYRVNLKHAISRVRKGERVGLELSFHDAT